MVALNTLLVTLSTGLLASAEATSLPDRRVLGEADEDGGNSLFAYLCDLENEKIKSDRPLELEDAEIRVCIERGRFAELNNLYIMKINNFEFYKQVPEQELVRQRVFDHGFIQEPETSAIISCEQGSSICSFETLLKDQFFDGDGVVKGIGNVAIQTGSGSRRDRDLQEFYGMTGITLEFAVEDGNEDNNPQYSRWNFKDHFNESPDHVQGLYIGGLVTLCLLCFCFCAGIILWKQCCADIVTRRSRDAPEDPEPIFVYTKDEPKDDVSETHSVDDELDVTSDGDEESDPSYDLERITYEEQPVSHRSAPKKKSSKSLLAIEPEYEEDSQYSSSRYSSRYDGSSRR